MPDFRAQFENPERVSTYMGGTSVGCGDHPTMPKKHRWSKVRVFRNFRDRICHNCGLTKGADE